MASKFDCKSSVFNHFLVKDNLIHNEVKPDVNFFQNIFLLTLNVYLSLLTNKVLETSLRMQFVFFVLVLENEKEL